VAALIHQSGSKYTSKFLLRFQLSSHSVRWKNSVPHTGRSYSSLRTQKQSQRTSRRSYCCSKQCDASSFHASSIHCTKVITRPRDPRLKEHPFLFSENSLPSIRSHNKPNKNPLVNNGLCPALVQLNKVQVKATKLNLYSLLPTEQVWFKGSCWYFLVYLKTLLTISVRYYCTIINL